MRCIILKENSYKVVARTLLGHIMDFWRSKEEMQ